MGSSKTKAVLLFMPALAFGVLLFGGYLMNRFVGRAIYMTINDNRSTQHGGTN